MPTSPNPSRMPTSPPDAPAPPPRLDPDLERGPLRRCIVTRETLPREAMLRFVLGPDARVVPDVAARLPGRGMWLKAERAALEQAMKKGAFARAAKARAVVPPDLPEQVAVLLRARLADLLGMARRAGQSVAGFQKVREWLQQGRVGVLLEATDGSAAERARLIGGHATPVVLALDAALLGQVFGRDGAVHVAVAPGRLAEHIRSEARRFAALA